jgi:hypothetical protein
MLRLRSNTSCRDLSIMDTETTTLVPLHSHPLYSLHCCHSIVLAAFHPCLFVFEPLQYDSLLDRPRTDHTLLWTQTKTHSKGYSFPRFISQSSTPPLQTDLPYPRTEPSPSILPPTFTSKQTTHSPGYYVHTDIHSRGMCGHSYA